MKKSGRMWRFERKILSVVLPAFMSAVAAVPVPAQTRAADNKTASCGKETADYGRQRRFDTFFLEYVVQKEKGNYDAAFDLLRHALEINPDAPEALSAMAVMKDAAGDEDSTHEVERMIRKAVELEPGNYYFQQQLAEYYDTRGMNDSAVARYEIMSQRFPEHEGLLFNLAEIYRSQKDYKSLVRTLSRLEVQEGKSDELAFRKIEAYSRAGMGDSALVLVNSLVKSDPANDHYRVLRGLVYGDMKDYAREMAEYKAVLAKDPDNEDVNRAIMNRKLAQNDIPAYLEKAESIAANEKMSVTARGAALKSVIMSCARGTTDSTAAMPICKKILAGSSPDASLIDMCQAYYVMLKRPSGETAPFWRKLLALKPGYSQIRLKLLQHCISNSLQAETARICDGGIENDPGNLIYYFYGGLAHFSLDQKDKALAMLQDGCGKIAPDSVNPDLASDYYALLGDVYHETGKDSLAFEAYDSSLEYNPDNINSLNNYAYFLSLKRQDLDKAAEMSLKTIKAEPKSPTYLDTYAWVLFEQGKYAEAATFIEEALKNIKPGKQNASIYEHAGDIYSKLGKTEKALQLWQKARGMGGNSEKLRQKIKARKYIAQ